MNKTKVIVLTGPTASGKTAFAVKLAKKIQGEIVSADSRQVFIGMDIGTGKDLKEYDTIPYHLIDIARAGSEFSVSDFQKKALSALRVISSRSHIPIICGGTGHYIKALLEGYQFLYPKTDLRMTIELERQDREALYKKLKQLDLWHLQDWENDSKRRMVRAIEKKQLQIKKSVRSPDFSSQFESRLYFRSLPREIIKQKIHDRLLQRMEEGMIEEVRSLLAAGLSHQRLERYGLEYKHVSFYLRDLMGYDEMLSKLRTEISRFAKRQMTFIRYLQKSGHHLHPVEDYASFEGDVLNWLSRE